MGIKAYHHLLNIGVVDEDKLHRVDLERMRLAAAEQTNILCDTVGKGFVRPGTGHLSENHTSAQRARLLSFVAGDTEAFQLEVTTHLRVRNCDDDVLLTRPEVLDIVSIGAIAGSGDGWSSSADGDGIHLVNRAHGAVAAYSCLFTIDPTMIAIEHGIRIVVAIGPVHCIIGSVAGGTLFEGDLGTGEYSIGIVPLDEDFSVVFSSKARAEKLILSCDVEAPGIVSIAAPWAAADLGLIRTAQSLDVMFIAARGYQQQRIERWNDRSWSLALYTSDTGPFMSVPSNPDIKLTPSGLEGNVTLTASAAFFTDEHVGATFALQHEGQRLDTYLAASSAFTDAIEITGINETNYNDRDYTYTISGTWVGTIKNQRSFDSVDVGYQEFRRAQAVATIDITANATYINDDNEDNAIGWYRIGFEAGAYTSGEAHVVAQYAGGSGIGVCRVLSRTSATVVEVEVLTPFKGNYATAEWRESAWSDRQQWPSAVMFADGRLWWFGEDAQWGSVSDEYANFDETVEGDAGPVLRSIAIGGRNRVQWAIVLSSPLLGTSERVICMRASSFSEILTPDNFKNVSQSKVGSAPVSALELADDRALFVEKAGTVIEELTFDAARSNFTATPFSRLTTQLFSSGIREWAATTIPDQRIWVVLENGQMVCIVFEPSQEVVAFIPIVTAEGDAFESVCVTSAATQDAVYVSVAREIGGDTVRFTEKFALDSEALPGDVTKCIDSHVSGGPHDATILATHLASRTDIKAWVDGAPVAGTLSADASGNIILPTSPTIGYCVGVNFDWAYESARLEYGIEGRTPITSIKAISGVSLLLADYVRSGITLQTRNGDGVLSAAEPMRQMVRGKTATNVVSGRAKDESLTAVPGSASIDTRLRVSGSSPNPASILGIVFNVETIGG